MWLIQSDALPGGLLQPGDELRAEDVDLPVEDAAAVRDLLLLLRVLVDQALQVLVGERGEIRERFHAGSLSGRRVKRNFSLCSPRV
jgi:hypothetical protein